MLRALLPLLLLLSRPPPTLALADFCDTDPRVHVSTTSCPSPHLHLALPELDRNPFHALHDILWVASHYLLHCAEKFSRKTISIDLLKPYNKSTCSEGFPKPRNNSAIWGLCAAAALAERHNAHLQTLPLSTRSAPCYSKTVHLGGLNNSEDGYGTLFPHFRKLSFYGRICLPCPAHPNLCASGTQLGSLIELPDEHKAAAVRQVAHAVLTYLRVSDDIKDRSLVRVLLYSRGDAVRRRWANVHEVRQRFEKDPRVELRYVPANPKPFREQVELYRWADVVVAPHGAAMVNTIFMRPGTDVVEVWKWCHEDIARERFLPHDWTGWHAGMMGINLQYVQCHDALKRYKERSELHGGKEGVMVLGAHKVRVEEILSVVGEAVERQRGRLRLGRRG